MLNKPRELASSFYASRAQIVPGAAIQQHITDAKHCARNSLKHTNNMNKHKHKHTRAQSLHILRIRSSDVHCRHNICAANSDHITIQHTRTHILRECDLGGGWFWWFEIGTAAAHRQRHQHRHRDGFAWSLVRPSHLVIITKCKLFLCACLCVCVCMSVSFAAAHPGT